MSKRQAKLPDTLVEVAHKILIALHEIRDAVQAAHGPLFDEGDAVTLHTNAGTPISGHVADNTAHALIIDPVQGERPIMVPLASIDHAEIEFSDDGDGEDEDAPEESPEDAPAAAKVA